AERDELASMLQAQAAALELCAALPAWTAERDATVARVGASLLELEYTLIPYGLHVVGTAPSVAERIDLLGSYAVSSGARIDPADRTQPARLRPVPHPERVCGPRRRAPGRAADRTLHRRRTAAAGIDRAGAVGHGQPQERRRPDRAGAGAPRCTAPLRRLRPA